MLQRCLTAVFGSALSLAATSIAAVSTLVGVPSPVFAASTGVVSLTITAPVLATISVSNGTVTCNVSSVVSLTAPCTTSATVSGNVRGSYNTITKVTVTGAAVNNSAATNSIAPTAFSMTCTDSSTGAFHGTLTLASATPLSTSAVACANWASSAGGNVLNVSEALAFTINSFLVPADTYTAANWIVTLTAS